MPTRLSGVPSYTGRRECSLCKNVSRTSSALAATFFFQAEDGIRDVAVTGVQTCALPICPGLRPLVRPGEEPGHRRAAPTVGNPARATRRDRRHASDRPLRLFGGGRGRDPRDASGGRARPPPRPPPPTPPRRRPPRRPGRRPRPGG